jgi:hypothetical protein
MDPGIQGMRSAGDPWKEVGHNPENRLFQVSEKPVDKPVPGNRLETSFQERMVQVPGNRSKNLDPSKIRYPQSFYPGCSSFLGTCGSRFLGTGCSKFLERSGPRYWETGLNLGSLETGLKNLDPWKEVVQVSWETGF